MAKRTQIGSLSTKLTLDSRGFSRGLKSAKDWMRTFGASLAGMGKRVLGFGAALTTVAAGAGFTALLKHVAETTDTLGKQADALGVSTESLAAYRHAAKLAGMDNEQVGKAIQMMQRNMADAAIGIGEAKRSFELLGIEAKDLIKLKPEEAFERLIDRIQFLPTAAQKVQTAMAIFGRGGLGVLALTNDGIKEAREQVEKFGLAITRIDTRKIELMNDAFTTMRSAFEGKALDVLVGIAPAFEAAANVITKFVSSLGRLDPDKLLNIAEKFAVAGAVMADAFAAFKPGSDTANSVTNQLAAGISKRSLGFKAFGHDLLRNLGLAKGRSIDVFGGEFSAAAGLSQDELSNGPKSFVTKMKDAFSEIRAELANLDPARMPSGNGFNPFADSEEAMERMLTLADQINKKFQPQQAAFKDEIESLKELHRAGLLTPGTFNRAVSGTVRQFSDLFDSTSLPRAITPGSPELQELQFQNQRENRLESISKRILDETQKQTQDIVTQLKQGLAILKQLGVPGVVTIP